MCEDAIVGCDLRRIMIRTLMNNQNTLLERNSFLLMLQFILYGRIGSFIISGKYKILIIFDDTTIFIIAGKIMSNRDNLSLVLII